MNTRQSTQSLIHQLLRILLGLFMLYAGIGHMTFLREAFQAQVPRWISTDPGLMDWIVLASGLVEIMLGALMVFGGRLRIKTGLALALFFILIFPGNINQYVHHIDSFGLDTDNKRLIRLFFQPLLVLWALWSTGAIHHIPFLSKNNKA